MNGGDLLQAGEEAISQAEFARRMSISKAAVTQGKAKRLAASAYTLEGKLRWPEAARQWKASAHPQADLKAQHQAATQAEPPAQSNAQASAQAADGGGSVPQLSGYRDAQARKAEYEAQLKEIDLNRARDRYRDRDDVERAMVTCGRAIRQTVDAVELWASDIAQLAGGEIDQTALRQLLRGKARELQQAMADTLTQYTDGDPEEAELDALAAASAGGDQDGDQNGDQNGDQDGDRGAAGHAVNA